MLSVAGLDDDGGLEAVMSRGRSDSARARSKQARPELKCLFDEAGAKAQRAAQAPHF